MKDPQTAGPPLPDPSERPEVPENLHSARQPLTNDWHKHPASFTPTAIALKCNPWSVPVRLSQTPLQGTDACLRSPSCLIPLPSGSHVPFQIVVCFFLPWKSFIITLCWIQQSAFSVLGKSIQDNQLCDLCECYLTCLTSFCTFFCVFLPLLLHLFCFC